MTASDLIALGPLLVVAVAALMATVSIALWRNRYLTFALALAGFAAAIGTLPTSAAMAPRAVTPLLVVDRYALFYWGLVFAAGGVVATLIFSYSERRPHVSEELYALLLLATLGAGVLIASSHFASFFLGLELLTVSLYVMIAYVRTDAHALEAGVKYLILAAASSAFLLFGMALIYAQTGTLAFARLAALPSAGQLDSPYVLMGLALLVTGVGFKLAVVPFHMWTPDVYEGAPAPVAAFVATVSKGAVVAVLLRYFVQSGAHGYVSMRLVLGLIAILSMFAGNLLALRQHNVKRILAYSSIAHLGYLLVAFVASGDLAAEAVTYYLATYFITMLGSFGVVTVLSDARGEADTIEDYRGLFWRRPWTAGVFTAMLLSLAGIPLTAGFVGKFYVVAAGVNSSLWALVVILAVNSAIGLYYYLRIVVAMYAPAEESETAAAAPAPPWAGGLVLAALAGALLWVGVYPAPLMRAVQGTIPSVSAPNASGQARAERERKKDHHGS